MSVNMIGGILGLLWRLLTGKGVAKPPGPCVCGHAPRSHSHAGCYLCTCGHYLERGPG